MGLFDSVRKKGLSHSEKVALAYARFPTSVAAYAFPGGQAQANAIITSLARICGLELDTCDEDRYFSMLLAYADAILRCESEEGIPSVVPCLLKRHGDLIRDTAVAAKAMKFILVNKMNNTYVYRSGEDALGSDLISDVLEGMAQTVLDNAGAQQRDLDDPEYGLVPDKPIYTNNVIGSRRYLESLTTARGERLTWNRRGSMHVQGIDGMIDVYDSTLPSGTPYKTLYINMYAPRNSDRVPEGFSK